MTTGNANDNGITITTGSAATSITASGASDIITVHASVLAQNTLLTLSGTAAFVVDGLVGDSDASALTGTLTVTTGDAADERHQRSPPAPTRPRSTAPAARARHRHGGRRKLADDKLLTLSGAADFVVTGLNGDLNADDTGLPLTTLTGTLSVTTVDNTVDDEITITTGTDTTTIDGAGGPASTPSRWTPTSSPTTSC